MQQIAMQLIQTAAHKAGLAENRVMPLSAADNLTLPRPRLEVQFLPVAYSRSGRSLALRRVEGVQHVKKELYIVTQDISLTIFAPDAPDAEDWIAAFTQNFITAMPSGSNDEQGNWVQARVRQTRFSKPPDKRVGESVIQVFTRVSNVLLLRLTGRVSLESSMELIQDIRFEIPTIK